VLCDVFLASIFLAYVEPKLFFAFARENSVTADGQKYAQFVKFGVLEIVRYIRRKEACHKAAHSSTVGEEHKKYVQV
jgi:SUMO ligase MMS21 Smc5/6 complex component